MLRHNVSTRGGIRRQTKTLGRIFADPDHRGVDLISDVLPFGRLWYREVPHDNRLRGVLQQVT
jgi:hypothetical protein